MPSVSASTSCSPIWCKFISERGSIWTMKKTTTPEGDLQVTFTRSEVASLVREFERLFDQADEEHQSGAYFPSLAHIAQLDAIMVGHKADAATSKKKRA